MLTENDICFRTHRGDIVDKDGYVVARDVLHLYGEHRVRQDLIVGYAVEIREPRNDHLMALYRQLVTDGCAREMEKALREERE